MNIMILIYSNFILINYIVIFSPTMLPLYEVVGQHVCIFISTGDNMAGTF